MNVKTEIGQKDYLNAEKFAFFRSPETKKENILWAIGFFIFLANLIFRLTVGQNLSKYDDYSLIIVIGALLVILGRIIDINNIGRRSLKKLKHEKPGTLGEHTIEIYSIGVSHATSTSKSYYKWNQVYSVEQNRHYIFIFLSLMIPIIIPKRDFESEEAAEEFYNYAYEHWEKTNVHPRTDWKIEK